MLHTAVHCCAYLLDNVMVCAYGPHLLQQVLPFTPAGLSFRVASLMRSVHGVRLAHPRRRRAAAAANTARAKELYGLGVLDAGVHSVAGSVTRFLVLSRDPTIASPTDPRPHKTSLAFALPEGPSRLYEALSVFGLRNLDICKARGDLSVSLCERCLNLPQCNTSDQTQI